MNKCDTDNSDDEGCKIRTAMLAVDGEVATYKTCDGFEVKMHVKDVGYFFELQRIAYFACPDAAAKYVETGELPDVGGEADGVASNQPHEG